MKFPPLSPAKSILFPLATVLLGVAVGELGLCQDSHREMIEGASPDVYWSFEKSLEAKDATWKQLAVGSPNIDAGARPEEFPLFDSENNALHLGPGSDYLRIQEAEGESPFDFDIGDTISIEAWVSPNSVRGGGYAYVVGKGRTYVKGRVENHNWAVRLKGSKSGAALTFLFRSKGDSEADSRTEREGEYHRWTSNQTFGVGDGWHHIAIVYTFGQGSSLKGYIDGKAVKGKWDLGGATDRAPVVDDDEVWIGSSMGGNKNSSFDGALDEIAIYRRELSADEIKARYRYQPRSPEPVEIPDGQIVFELFDGVSDARSWNFRTPRFMERFTQPTFAMTEIPKKYSNRAIQIDRPTPFLLRGHARIELPKGKLRMLVRSRESFRLFLDDRLVGEAPFYDITVEANGPIWDLDRSHAPNIRPLQRGDRQVVIELEGDGAEHVVRFETLVGLNNRRPEIGETLLALARPESEFAVFSFDSPFDLTEDGWARFKEHERQSLIARNRERRAQVGAEEFEYWDQRHDLARAWVRDKREGKRSSKALDEFVEAKLSEHGAKVVATTDDLTFLRRVTLDLLGVIPTRGQIDAYLTDPPEVRRERVVDRLLNDPGWADHWVPYWQDVLAENPNIVNPSLNNTGPFRWWIYESFLENKPMDQFATELVRMEGSKYFGAPAGFSLATENDVPMAAKAHVLGQAFLGLQMQCARCHDAPAHDVSQRDLFSLAAMLQREAVKVPKTSSILLPPEELEQMAVEVTLKPGESVAPEWSFEEIGQASLPEQVLRGSTDTREELAALITMPQNTRFAKVMVNRLWSRYLGRGIVDSVDDWEGAEPSHPELLDWLADEFVASGYDLKHVSRLIVTSQAYARVAIDRGDERAELFAGPTQRKMTAEQLVDSLFVFSGKRYNAGPMAIDIDGARPPTLSLHLGEPRRAWMFSATSNERDRPSLALPFAQPFIAFLEQFGWRGARQNPIHERPDDLTAMQPAEFANGVLVRRATRLSDDHEITKLAMRSELQLDSLANELYMRLYTRAPTDRESALVQAFLKPGFESRVIEGAPQNELPQDRRGMVSWSVHLEEVASEIKMELQELVTKGDLPTKQLDASWRERLEDVLWSMLNSPEFRFAP